jgi:hypothetical protein
MRMAISSHDQRVLIMIILLDFFLENEDTYFDKVRTTIYRQLGLLENQYFLSIRARYNTGRTSVYHFCLIPIQDERVANDISNGNNKNELEND